MTKTSLFNPVEYLQSDAEIASYLTEAYEDENPAVFIVALGHVVRSKGYQTWPKKRGLTARAFIRPLAEKLSLSGIRYISYCMHWGYI